MLFCRASCIGHGSVTGLDAIEASFRTRLGWCTDVFSESLAQSVPATSLSALTVVVRSTALAKSRTDASTPVVTRRSATRALWPVTEG